MMMMMMLLGLQEYFMILPDEALFIILNILCEFLCNLLQVQYNELINYNYGKHIASYYAAW